MRWRKRRRRADELRAERARAAAREERTRIAREMHDMVAHSLAVIVRQADAAGYAARADPAAAEQVLATVAATGREALRDMGGLLRGTAWVGGMAGITHWAVFSTLCALRLAGAVGCPHSSTYPVVAMRHYDWANLFYFEPWFGIIGILLIAGARVAIPRARGATSASQAPAPMRRLGTVLTVAGVAVVLWAVFTFDPRIFAGYGPALVAAGLLVLAIDRRRTPNNVHVPAGALPTHLGAVQPPIKPRG